MDYIVNDAALTATADAIRGKTGSTNPITWLEELGFSEAIAAIESVGGSSIDILINKSITEASSNVTSIGHYAFYYCSKLTTADFPAATSIGIYAFENCSELTTVNFPVVTSIDTSAFYYCPKLTTADFPAVTSIGSNAFQNCSGLTTVNFPVATSIGGSAFRQCPKLTTVNFPVATSIGGQAFQYCSALTALILRKTDIVCTLNNTNAFANSAIASGKGYIYVPSALIDNYKAATNWSTYAAQFRALEDYTIDGTTTGDLDPNKI